MRTLLVLLCLFGLTKAQGQKVIKKAFLNPNTEFVQINSEFCYQVTLQTSETNEVQIEANMEGEYAKDLVVNLEEKGSTMLISAGFHPNFTNPNDKLSAHKVISIALQITVPVYHNVAVFGTNSNLDVAGKYKNLAVKLSSGRCTLNNVSETVDVETQNGDIHVTALQGTVEAKSAYGQVNLEKIPYGDNRYVLNTVEGTILLTKTK